jgi:hypothetical protein
MKIAMLPIKIVIAATKIAFLIGCFPLRYDHRTLEPSTFTAIELVVVAISQLASITAGHVHLGVHRHPRRVRWLRTAGQTPSLGSHSSGDRSKRPGAFSLVNLYDARHFASKIALCRDDEFQ